MYNEKLQQKFFTYLTSRLELKPSTKGYYRGDCPYCEGRYTFGVNFEAGKTNCFKCPEGSTTLVNLVKFIAQVKTFPEVINLLNMQDDYSFVFKGKKKEAIEVVQLELPESYTRIDMGESTYGRIARSYMKGRGFKLSKLVEKGIGYCTDGPHEGYLIIPYINMGKLVYYTARKLVGNGPKFKNPEEEKYGIGKSQLIYNQDALLMYDRVNIVESATNALTLRDNSSALGGKSLSPFQKWLLLKAPVEKYVIILDHDAQVEAIELALELIEHKWVKVVYLTDDRDVNKLGKKLAYEAIRSSKYQSQRELLNHLRDLKFKK